MPCVVDQQIPSQWEIPIPTNVALGLEYDGTCFHGFQSQPEGRNVQDVLEAVVSEIADESINVAVAGRTDTGVHATQQVVSFSTSKNRPLTAWLRGANTLLPNDLAVTWATEVPESFHARFSAQWRRYWYVFGQAEVVPAIGRHMAAWTREELAPERMDAAIRVIEGEHDFSSFRAAGCQSSCARRRVNFARVWSTGIFVVLDVQANSFVLRMVRNLAGALLAVSRGELSQRGLRELLSARDRRLAPPTASATGLYLVQVGYEKLPQTGTPRVPPILGASVPVNAWSAPS